MTVEGVDLFVIENSGAGGGFLMRTEDGKPVFGPLSLARTYSSGTALKNQVTRIKADFDVRYRQARLELKP